MAIFTELGRECPSSSNKPIMTRINTVLAGSLVTKVQLLSSQVRTLN
jgi:hypothetical protein